MAERPPEDRGRVDLAVAVAWCCLCWVVVAVPPVNASPVRPLAVVPAALVLPGYAVLVAAVPRDRSTNVVGWAVERLVLAISASVAVCILVGIALLSTPVPVTGVTVLLPLTAVILVGAGIAARRRDGPAVSPASTRRGELATLADVAALPDVTGVVGRLRGTDRTETGAVSATVAVLVVVATVAGGVGTAALLGVHDPAGHAALAVEPAGTNASIAEVRVTDGTPLRVSLVHDRSQPATYTVVALVERTDASGAVVATERLDTFPVSLDPGERWTTRHRATSITSENASRLVYELYRGDSAESDRRPRTGVHVWVNASTSTGSNSTTSAGPNGTPTAGVSPP